MDGNSRPANSVHATSDSVAVLTIPNSGLMDRIGQLLQFGFI
jgi:hypothetical protein